MLQARTSVSKDENDVMARDLPERTNGQAQLWASRQARPATTPRLPKLHLNPEIDRYLLRIVEHFACHTQPLAQSIPAGVIEGHA